MAPTPRTDHTTTRPHADPVAPVAPVASAATSTTVARATVAIRVMVIASLRSSPSANPGLLAGALAAARAVNASQAAAGRTIQVVACDTGGTAAGARACANEAVFRSVLAVVGYVPGPGSDDVVATLQAAGIVLLGGVLGTGADRASPVSFPFDSGPIVADLACPTVLRLAGAATVSLVRGDGVAGDFTHSVVVRGVASAKVTLAADDIVVTPTTSDIGPSLQAALASKSDGVIVDLPEQQTVEFVRAAHGARARFKTCTAQGAIDDATLAAMGPTVTDYYATGVAAPLVPSVLADAAQYATEMDAELAAGTRSAEASLRSVDSFRAWTAVHVFAQLVRAVPGAVTARAVQAAVSAAAAVPTGPFGVLNFAQPGVLAPAARNLRAYQLLWDPTKAAWTMARPDPFDASGVLR
jgi:ABC-type branched-subunit amino acid transport system substrate-binding protein